MIRYIKNYLLSKRAYKFFISNWDGIADINAARYLVAMMRHSAILKPIVDDTIHKKSILIIAPHPDDEIIGMGGSLYKMLAQGARVKILYLTKGNTQDTHLVIPEIKQIAASWGYETQFLNAYSKNIILDKSYLDSFEEAIMNFQTDTIFLPFLLDDHDDHRIASELLLTISKRKNIKFKCDIWAYQVYSVLPANYYIDITNVIDKKINAIEQLKSQMQRRDWINYAKGMNAFNSRFAINKDQKYLESFFVVPVGEYLKLCEKYFLTSNKCYSNQKYDYVRLL